MKKSVMVLKGTPFVPCLLLISTVMFWFLTLLTDNGKWVVQVSGLSFEGVPAFEIFLQILSLASPLLLFLVLLFLAEKSVYWIFLPLLLPIVSQLSLYGYNVETPDFVLDCPIQFSLPFLTLILFALTVLGILPSKWIFFGFCVGAAFLPVVLTLLGKGEYVYVARGFDYTLHDFRWWSDVLSLGSYTLAMGTLVFFLNPAPTEGDNAPIVPSEELSPSERS